MFQLVSVDGCIKAKIYDHLQPETFKIIVFFKGIYKALRYIVKSIIKVKC